MNKLVYLFELDSVRKTDKEVYKGQLAMYDELVGNGNIIVMSMNQITDSKTFLSMLQDDEHYNIVKKLLQKGYIRISRYGDIRTVSQYVQNAINKNLAKNDDVFIFSAIPVKSNQKLLLKLMQKVLINTDLSIIQEYIDLEDNQKVLELFNEYSIEGIIRENIDINKAKEYLEFLYRFLELIIVASMYGDSVTPPIKYDEIYKEKKFFDIMDIIISFEYDINKFPLLEETIIILSEIKNELDFNSGNEKNSRSVWIKKIKKLDGKKNKENLYYAELIVDLCYNYAVELSIYGVSKHYERDGDINIESFKREFISRLKYEWNNGESYKYAKDRFLQKETHKYVPYKEKYPDWKRGIRIISRRKHIEVDFKDDYKIPLYEYLHKNQRKKEKRNDFWNILKAVVTTILNTLFLCFINNEMSYLQDYINPFVKSLITFLAIAFLNDFISTLFNLPNILECVQIIVKSLVDVPVIILRKSEAYTNEYNENNNHMEEMPQILGQTDRKSNVLQEYIHIWRDRPDMFRKHNNMIIIEPTEEGIKEIIKYEAIHNKNIGVVYKSDYNMMVVDLIQSVEGKYSTYERLIPTVQKGAVVIVPVYKDKFILLNQFRHAIREKQLSFPRGYGEMDIDAENNAIKEIKEELGAEIIDKPQKLGSVVADSGISANKVMIYTVNVDEYKEKVGYEGIESIQLKTEKELITSIKNGEINDGYTLAAYALYMNKPK